MLQTTELCKESGFLCSKGLEIPLASYQNNPGSIAGPCLIQKSKYPWLVRKIFTHCWLYADLQSASVCIIWQTGTAV